VTWPADEPLLPIREVKRASPTLSFTSHTPIQSRHAQRCGGDCVLRSNASDRHWLEEGSRGRFHILNGPGKLGALLEKVREVGVPPKATTEWLKSIGFSSSNDRSMLAVLKQIGFIDGSSVPTARWKSFRGKDGQKALADAIRTGYAELYSTYSDAQDKPTSDLESFFRIHTDAGKQAIDKTVRTFRALASSADFSVAAGAAPTEDANTAPELQGTTITSSKEELGVQPVTVNINVQLVLPESTDEEVYRKFFAAMRENLLSPKG
jgi:predicted secreted protein